MKTFVLILIPIITLSAYLSVGIEFTTDFSEFSSGFFPFIGLGEGDFELRFGFRNFNPIWVVKLEGLYRKEIGWIFLSGSFSTTFPLGRSDFQPVYEITASVGKDFRIYVVTASLQGGVSFAVTGMGFESAKILSYLSFSLK